MLSAGKALEARYAFSEAVRVDSKNAQAFHGLGFTYLLQNKLQDAIICFEESLLRNPDQLDVYHNLATAWRNSGMTQDAVKVFRRALKRFPTSANTYVLLGHTLFAANQLEDAETAFKKAVMLQGDHAEAHYHLAVVYHVTGAKEQKIKSLKEAIRSRPNYAMAHQMLAESQTISKRGPYLDIMERFYASTEISLDDKIILAFALGKAHDDLKDYGRAFSYYKEGNELKRGTFQFDINSLIKDLSATSNVINKEWMMRRRDFGSRDDTPIFIVGMPRSGTTLVEQILSSHPKVHGAGELNLIPREIMSIEKQRGNTFPYVMENFTGEDVQRMGTWYLTALKGYSGAAHIVDKLPGNFLYVGLIKAMFPKAKIIHCQRRSMDNGLSLFKHFFGESLTYAYDLYETGRFIQAYKKLMQHWQEILPEGSIHTVSYEALVQNPDAEIKSLVAHCNLKWDSACLQFHTNTRPVHTTSADQVRMPIYNSSVGQSENYKSYLAALEAGLNY